MPEATLTEVIRFFEYDGTTAFRKDWQELTKEDQAQLREGIGNGSFTY